MFDFLTEEDFSVSIFLIARASVASLIDAALNTKPQYLHFLAFNFTVSAQSGHSFSSLRRETSAIIPPVSLHSASSSFEVDHRP